MSLRACAADMSARMPSISAWNGASAAVLCICFTVNGKRSTRESTVVATIVHVQGSPVETLSSSIVQRARPAGVQLASPSAARSP